MGIKAIFDAVKTRVQAEDPTVEFLLTAEAVQFQGNCPRVVWELPEPGGEEFNRRQLGPGYGPDTAVGRLLWARNVTCNIHVWMQAGGVGLDGVEYPDDNEDPSEGDVWLVQRVIRAIHTTCAGQYELTRGGWGPRTEANLGFLYVFAVQFKLGVFDTGLPAQIAEITSFSNTVQDQ